MQASAIGICSVISAATPQLVIAICATCILTVCTILRLKQGSWHLSLNFAFIGQCSGAQAVRSQCNLPDSEKDWVGLVEADEAP